MAKKEAAVSAEVNPRHRFRAKALIEIGKARAAKMLPFSPPCPLAAWCLRCIANPHLSV
ncbi:MAG: hypothetical protein L0Y60_00215 [Beijerinckiaceae bacterium]|nr:hypothetical protein [Beijerinckiaceae bacterium]